MNNTHSFFRDKAVLITGASSGIGEELALQLAQAGAKLTLAARRREPLEAVAQKIAALDDTVPIETPSVVTCDVARDGDIELAVAKSVRQWGKLDVVFANAGFGVVGGFKKLSVGDYRRQFETNVFGVLRTVFAALPELEKSRGNLAITGSVSGWVSPPGASPYCMSKFAVRALANSITPDLCRAGVKLRRQQYPPSGQSWDASFRSGGSRACLDPDEHGKSRAPDSPRRCARKEGTDRYSPWQALRCLRKISPLDQSRLRRQNGVRL
jgi:NADP-dependent 3-hydroxy acid dehydrogenase YdfG